MAFTPTLVRPPFRFSFRWLQTQRVGAREKAGGGKAFGGSEVQKNLSRPALRSDAYPRVLEPPRQWPSRRCPSQAVISYSLMLEMRRDNFAGERARNDRNELERHTATAPVQRPLLQQSRVIALHQLKATTEVRLDPAVDVPQALGQPPPGVAHASIHWEACRCCENVR